LNIEYCIMIRKNLNDLKNLKKNYNYIKNLKKVNSFYKL
jgi:hypothetical protein